MSLGRGRQSQDISAEGGSVSSLFLVLVTAVGTDNSDCSALVVAEAQREMAGWHVLSSLHLGADRQQGENSWNH